MKQLSYKALSWFKLFRREKLSGLIMQVIYSGLVLMWNEPCILFSTVPCSDMKGVFS